MKDMQLDAVGAMLFAGDATNPDPGDDDGVNPYELGIQFSVSF